MKSCIIQLIKAQQSEKQKLNKVPANPNELELMKGINELFRKELEALITDGAIDVVGTTINKQRILKYDENRATT